MILFVLLALDCAGFFHGDIPSTPAAVIALVLAVVALLLDLRGRGAV
jgi:hypothetical protein